MNAIRCGRDEPLVPPSVYPDDDQYDGWLDRARLTWTAARKVNADDADIVCALALVRGA